MVSVSDKIRFFPTPASWRSWLSQHHATATELWVGFYRKDSGKPSITWPESVAGALCFGWIDGVRKRIDETSYKMRFTPRKARSNWSRVNLAMAEELIAAGLMTPAGTKAYEARLPERSGIYAYENRKNAALSPADEKRFRADKAAWKFFQSCPPGYRSTVTWWIVSAKKEETRQRRLATLIADSAAGRTIRQLTRTPRK